MEHKVILIGSSLSNRSGRCAAAKRETISSNSFVVVAEYNKFRNSCRDMLSIVGGSRVRRADWWEKQTLPGTNKHYPSYEKTTPETISHMGSRVCSFAKPLIEVYPEMRFSQQYHFILIDR